MESKTKRKLVATGVATATTAALLLTGTYAWQSISQQALNAASDSINPGGRLHDDFNGTDKRIYVENFADDEIYARIRLSEYMELGRDAGVDVGTENRKVTIVTENASYDDKATWQVHYYDQANATDEYWTWEMTGDGVPYMPTFNKDKDSLTADINGTYEQNYEDYVDYSLEENESKIANARYDIDTDDIDEDKDGEGAVEGEDIEYIEETHTVKMTSSSCIMTMEEWGLLEDSEKEATECWIYDIDGWAYWSKPIKGGETTGTILRSIAVKNVDDNWYYAINAEAQFVTADDLGYSDNTGFYTDANSAPTAEALELLKYIGVTVEEVVREENDTPIKIGMSYNGDYYYDDEVLQYFDINLSDKTYLFDAQITTDNGMVAADSVSWSFSNNNIHTVADGADEQAGLKLALATEETATRLGIEEGDALASIDPTTGEMKLLIDPEPQSQTIYVEATATYEGETWTEDIPVFLRSDDIRVELYSEDGSYDAGYIEGVETTITIDPQLKILNVEQADTKIENWSILGYTEGEETEVPVDATISVQDDGTAIVNIPSTETAELIIVRGEYVHDGSDGLLASTYSSSFRITKSEPTEIVNVDVVAHKMFYEPGDIIESNVNVNYENYDNVPEANKNITYEVTDGDGNALTTTTSVNEKGVLTIADDETAESLILKVIVTVDGDIADRTQKEFTSSVTIQKK